MKGNDKLVQALNGLLADELTAINQYVVHAEMADNWGYGKLKKSVHARAGNVDNQLEVKFTASSNN
jgi:bacterioferritin